MSRFAYFFRETLISLRRNLLMTFAGIITVTVSLFLFGGIMLVSRTVDHGTERWKHGVQLEIFMGVHAGQNQIDAVRDDLSKSKDVKTFKFLTKNDALKEFKKIFANQPSLVENVKADVLPTSFRVTPVTAELTAQVKNSFKNRPGVDEVVTAQEQVDRLLTLTRHIKIAFFAITAALLASSLFLIVNTIRLATFARRREIEVMKLVGASNWFVRIPFMAEGMVQGTLGAGVAFLSVWILRVIIGSFLDGQQHNLLSTFRVTNADAIGIGFWMLLIGATIGTVGSLIGLRRFLEA